jgi:outer membrane protein
MKNISTILSVIALVVAGVVFFVQDREIGQLKKQSDGGKDGGKASAGVSAGPGFRIAYFDLDSLQAHYEYMKDVKNQAVDKENSMNQSLASQDRKNQLQIDTWRQKGNTMTPAEAQEANQKYQQMQQDFAAQKQQAEQELFKYEEGERSKIRKKVEDYIKEYNKTKNYSYIIAYDANAFIYNKDTLYNITNELIQGLNGEYKKLK